MKKLFLSYMHAFPQECEGALALFAPAFGMGFLFLLFGADALANYAFGMSAGIAALFLTNLVAHHNRTKEEHRHPVATKDPKPPMKQFLALLACCLPCLSQSLTCIIVSGGQELERFTNVVSIIADHEKKVPPCHLIRYVQNGITNEFHAWAVGVVVITNKVDKP